MSNSMLGPVAKYSGAGNTFAIVDARSNMDWVIQEKKLGIQRSQLVRDICDVRLGLGVDGFLFIEDGSSSFDYQWDFYNLDGSTAEMCGNAARCAARFCFDYGLAPGRSELVFKTGAGLVPVRRVSEREFEVLMPSAAVRQEALELNTQTQGRQHFFWVNTGVPHIVQEAQNIIASESLRDLAKEVRSHPQLGPEGANVTFFSEIELDIIKAITFERGVEDFTMACGTGAVAAARAYVAMKKTGAGVRVEMPGGDLNVSFVDGFEHPRLLGRAVMVGEFKYNFKR